jgi:hypothetical protein
MRYQLHGPCRTHVKDMSLSVEVPEPAPQVILPLKGGDGAPSAGNNRGRRSGSMAPPVMLPGAVVHLLKPTILIHMNEFMVASAPAKLDCFTKCKDKPIDAELCTMEQLKKLKVGELRDIRGFAIDGLTLSVPMAPPHRWHDPTVARDLHHVLFLFPRCNATVVFDWKTHG